MTGETLTRRGLLGGMLSIIAAPAIVRASSLMPVKSVKVIDFYPSNLIWSQKTPEEIVEDMQTFLRTISIQSQVPVHRLLGNPRPPQHIEGIISRIT